MRVALSSPGSWRILKEGEQPNAGEYLWEGEFDSEGVAPFVYDEALDAVRNKTEAEALADLRFAKLAQIRVQAASHITAKWPLWAQNNCALGVYPDATVAQCASDIAAVIAASNTAEDAVTAATTVAEVEAVTATWPTL